MMNSSQLWVLVLYEQKNDLTRTAQQQLLPTAAALTTLAPTADCLGGITAAHCWRIARAKLKQLLLQRSQPASARPAVPVLCPTLALAAGLTAVPRPGNGVGLRRCWRWRQRQLAALRAAAASSSERRLAFLGPRPIAPRLVGTRPGRPVVACIIVVTGGWCCCEQWLWRWYYCVIVVDCWWHYCCIELLRRLLYYYEQPSCVFCSWFRPTLLDWPGQCWPLLLTGLAVLCDWWGYCVTDCQACSLDIILTV